MGQRQTILPYIMGQEVIFIILFFTLIGCGFFGWEYWKNKEHIKEHVNVQVQLDELSELERMIAKLIGDKKDEWKKIIDDLRRELHAIDKDIGVKSEVTLLEQIQKIRAKIRELLRLIEKPPIFTLTEANGYFFESGKAEISDEFKKRLIVDIIPKIAEMAELYKVNQIEVIGHTDEVPMKGYSNLDPCLIPYARGEDKTLTAGDNVGLGMARAAAVVRILAQSPLLEQFKLAAYSGGQVVTLEGQLSNGNDPTSKKERRRIEIRLKRA